MAEVAMPFKVRMLCSHVEIRLMVESQAGKPWTPEAELLSGGYCRGCPGEPRVPRPHERDTDCSLDDSDGDVCPSCMVCGVTFGDPCAICRGRGFHFEGCEKGE